jgi:peptidoglycan/LPS O-acetylase OafA/YrhL
VFFLVSGYIVPASLEHKGDVRSIWVNRVFRLYPRPPAAVARGLAPDKADFRHSGTACTQR